MIEDRWLEEVRRDPNYHVGKLYGYNIAAAHKKAACKRQTTNEAHDEPDSTLEDSNGTRARYYTDLSKSTRRSYVAANLEKYMVYRDFVKLMNQKRLMNQKSRFTPTELSVLYNQHLIDFGREQRARRMENRRENGRRRALLRKQRAGKHNEPQIVQTLADSPSAGDRNDAGTSQMKVVLY